MRVTARMPAGIKLQRAVAAKDNETHKLNRENNKGDIKPAAMTIAKPAIKNIKDGGRIYRCNQGVNDFQPE